MKTHGDYESRLWRILGKEGVADLSQYHRFGFFDEVPLYSRYSDVAFLRDLGRKKADSLLLRFGLKFLKALTWYEVPEWPFFASLTIWNNPKDELIVPNIFVCSGNVNEEIGHGLALHEVDGPPSKRLSKLLSQLHMLDSFQVLEDSATVPGITRVFIGYMIPPYPNVVPLHVFQKKTASRPQRA